MIPKHIAEAALTNGITRRAKERTCTCGAPIFVGLDADRCAGEVRVDTKPVTAAGEALAILSGRSTYLLRTGLRPELDHRTQWHIAGTSADDTTVLAAHTCGAPPLPTKPTPPPPTQEVMYAPPF